MKVARHNIGRRKPLAPVAKLTWVVEPCGECAACGATILRGDVVKHGMVEHHGKLWCAPCGKGHEGYFDVAGVDILQGIPMLGVDAI